MRYDFCSNLAWSETFWGRWWITWEIAIFEKITVQARRESAWSEAKKTSHRVIRTYLLPSLRSGYANNIALCTSVHNIPSLWSRLFSTCYVTYCNIEMWLDPSHTGVYYTCMHYMCMYSVCVNTGSKPQKQNDRIWRLVFSCSFCTK